MPWTADVYHPAPASEEEAYAHLAMAILVGLVSDLQCPSPQRRSEARAAVEAHVGDFWLELLALDDGARWRVQALLWELAH